MQGPRTTQRSTRIPASVHSYQLPNVGQARADVACSAHKRQKMDPPPPQSPADAVGRVTLAAPLGRRFVSINLGDDMTVLLREDLTGRSFNAEHETIRMLTAQSVERLKRREADLLRRGMEMESRHHQRPSSTGASNNTAVNSFYRELDYPAVAPKTGRVELVVKDSGCWIRGCRKSERYVGPSIRLCSGHAEFLGLRAAVVRGEHERNAVLWAVVEGGDVRVFLPRAKQLTKVTRVDEAQKWLALMRADGNPSFAEVERPKFSSAISQTSTSGEAPKSHVQVTQSAAEPLSYTSPACDQPVQPTFCRAGSDTEAALALLQFKHLC